MYRNVLLAILVIFAGLIAVGLSPARRHLSPPLLPGPEDRLLATRVVEFSPHGILVPAAVELLSRKSEVPIKVEWESFKEYRNEPADLDLHDVRLDDAVAAIFTQNRINPTHIPPAVNVAPSGKIIVVTATYPTPAAWVSTRVYDVRDLLRDEYWGSPPTTPGLDLAKDRVEKLANVVFCMHNWEFSGVNASHYSTYGHQRIEGRAGCLIVTETRSGHEGIALFLAVLRGQRGIADPSR